MTSRTHAEPTPALAFASRTDVGRVRSVNEDSHDRFVRADGAQLFVVADGMGGHRGGATASREAVARIGASFGSARATTEGPARARPEAMLIDAIESANRGVHGLAREDPSLAGMGTTIVALQVEADGRAAVAHVGDSRAYRFRDRRLEALTTDHSVVAEMLRRGVLTPEEAAYHPRRNEILRSVGVLPSVEVEVAALELAAGDWILLCSDGLCGVASDAEIDEVLAAAATPEAAAEALVALANACGGPDNVTVAIVAVPERWRKAGPDASSSTQRAAPAAPVEAGSRRAQDDGRGAAGTVDAAAAVGPARARGPVFALLAALALLVAGAWWLARRG